MSLFAHLIYILCACLMGVFGVLIVGYATRWDWAWIGFVAGVVIWYGLVDRIEPK